MSIKLPVIFKRYEELILLAIIITVSLLIRIYLIDKIPTNITGDESWDLSNIYRIVFSKNIGPLTPMGDGSVSGIVFYPVAILIKIFGAENSLFFLRANIIFYSLLSLIPFYLILKQKTSILIAFLFTILLSANYVFLNFSRTAWVNMMCISSGLFLIYFIEKAIREKNIKWYLVSGIFAGVSFYAYHYGRIFVIGVLFYLLINLFKNKFKKIQLRGFFAFLIAASLVALPYLYPFITNEQEPILRRPSATFVFSNDKLSKPNSFEDILIHQLDYTIRGFILLDKSVMNEGVENSRYLPLKTPPVNLVMEILFLPGLLFFVVKRKESIWWVVFITVLITQALSDLPPNFSRGLFYIPFIYFVAGVFLYEIMFLSKRYIKSQNFIYLSIAVSIALFIFDVNLYFNWMNKTYEYNARQPAIDYNEFYIWQNYQINLAKKGEYPITNYAWYDIKDSLIKK